MVRVGEKAPDFIAPAVSEGEAYMLELSYIVERHEAVLVVFQPANFIPAATSELCAIQEAGWPGEESLAIVCLTGDSLYSHAAYADRYEFTFPLVSDFHGSIAQSYGVMLDEWEGHTQIPGRAAIVIDGDWNVMGIELNESPLERTATPPTVALAETIRQLGLAVSEPQTDVTDR